MFFEGGFRGVPVGDPYNPSTPSDDFSLPPPLLFIADVLIFEEEEVERGAWAVVPPLFLCPPSPCPCTFSDAKEEARVNVDGGSEEGNDEPPHISANT